MKRHIFTQKVAEYEKKNQDERKDPYMDISTRIIFTHMIANQGIKLFGEQSVSAMLSEYKELNEGSVPGKPVVGTICLDTLSFQEH